MNRGLEYNLLRIKRARDRKQIKQFDLMYGDDCWFEEEFEFKWVAQIDAPESVPLITGIGLTPRSAVNRCLECYTEEIGKKI